MFNLLVLFHMLIALAIIGIVLLQHGKGSEAGAAFGSGASQTIFGSQGSMSFLAKATMILALLFASSSLFLSKYGLAEKASNVVDLTQIAPAKPAADAQEKQKDDIQLPD